MATRSRSSQKGPLWHGYRRPVWRDGVFWLAVGTSLAGLLVQNAFGNFEATGRGWAILGIEVLVTFAVVFALIGVIAGTLRGFGEGWRQAEQTAPPRGSTAITAPTAPPASSPPEPKVAAEPERAATAEPAATGPAPTSERGPVAPSAQSESEPESAPEPEPEPEPEPARPAPDPTGRPKAGVEMERQARRLGRAFAAGRRTYKKYDES